MAINLKWQEEHEKFLLWVYAETIYVSLHLVTHIAFNLLQDFDLYQLLTVESLIIYAYCVLRVVSIVVIDTYFKYISSRRLKEAFGGQGREYWELLSQWHRQRHEDQQKAQPESKEQVSPSGT